MESRGTENTKNATGNLKKTLGRSIESRIYIVSLIKGIVSRGFEWLQMILMKRLYVPDVPLEVYSF